MSAKVEFYQNGEKISLPPYSTFPVEGLALQFWLVCLLKSATCHDYIDPAQSGQWRGNPELHGADLRRTTRWRKSITACPLSWDTKATGRNGLVKNRPPNKELLALLRPCPDERLKIWRVDNKV